MSIIDKIEKHYSSLGQTEVEIPELGETFYFKPITVVSLDKIAAKIAHIFQSQLNNLWTLLFK